MSDALCALLAGSAASLLRFGGITPSAVPYLVPSGVLPLLWTGMIALHRGYDPRLIAAGPEEFRRVVRSGCALAVLAATAAFLAKADLSRGYLLIASSAAAVLTLAGRCRLRRSLRRRRARGEDCVRRVVAVGRPPQIAELADGFRREPHHGMAVVAACLPGDGAPCDPEHVGGVPVLGDLTDVPLVVEQARADAVAVLACAELDGAALRTLAWRLERSKTDLMVAPALMEVAGPRTSIRPAAGFRLLRVEHPELAGASRLIKGAFDRLVAAVALAVLAPVLAAIALAVRVTGREPALLRQTRVGKDGVEFTLLKFRTLRRDVRTCAVELAGDGREVPVMIRRDLRLTRLGRLLRRYSLDELPQLINVLRGDMSLVGPRPPLPEEVARYGDDVRRRLVVRPGMTGLWQVDGRPDLSWEESVRLDLRYVENWSVMLDLQILWQTWSAVVRRAGAHGA